ncbi:MAG: EAL domain-containing protein [Vibrio sp.]
MNKSITLYKQLLTWVLGIFVAMTVILFAINFSNTRSELIEYQQVEFNSTSHAASVALASYLSKNDKDGAETLIKSMFDKKDYQLVKLIPTKKAKMFEYRPEEPEVAAPGWFMSLASIAPIKETLQVNEVKWEPLANLRVISNPARAYEKLWSNTKSNFLVMLFACVITAVGLSFIFKHLLEPLQKLRVSAQHLANNQFDEALEPPKYQELNEVVVAFNQMSTQIRSHFDQQSEEADKLRVRAYQDPVSGLANRSYMMTQLQSWLDGTATGGVALLKADMIDDVYDKEGYDKGDELTQTLSKSLMEITDEEYTIARLNRSEYLMLAPNTSDEDMMLIGRSMLNMAATLQNDPLDIAPLQAAVALVMRNENDSISNLLARADNGLVQARTNRAEPLFLVPTDSDANQPAFGKQQWIQIVKEAIANKEITLSYQKAIDRNNHMLHQEVFAAIEHGDERYSAGKFLNAIESLDRGPEFDMHVVDCVFEQCKQYNPKYPIAVNLTQSSVNDTGFMRWLGKKMETHPQFATKVCFEIPEICFIKQPDNTKLLCNIIASNHYQFGIDNFGHNFGSIGYLNAYRPAYVKLDFAYTKQVDENEKADVVFSIARTASNLSITTIASRVETMEQKDKLIELELGGFQGFVTQQINSIEEVNQTNEGQA